MSGTPGSVPGDEAVGEAGGELGVVHRAPTALMGATQQALKPERLRIHPHVENAIGLTTGSATAPRALNEL